MYWGRGSFYRTLFHVLVFGVTIISLIAGISSRINIFDNASDRTGLVLASGVYGNVDTLYQAGTTEAITATNPNAKNWPEFRHVVKAGENLESIGKIYGVSKATIIWANNLRSESLKIDQVLIVPGLNGVLYTVLKGDTVESISKKTGGAIFDIVELNELIGIDAALSEGDQVFIPNGVIQASTSARRPTSYTPNVIVLDDPGVDVPPGTFVNPLLSCPGYYISRGVSSWHTGVDLAKNGGCWINATAS